MTFQRVIPSFFCAVLLSACAGMHGNSSDTKPASLASAMTDADAAVLAGQTDKAYGILKNASSTFPTEKTPWLRMAQMRYDTKDYGEAIVNALEALQRDPEDTLANSIVAVSGLRVSSKALADLTQTNNLSGPVRSEAQDLAKLLRSALGEEKLVPEQTTRSIAHKEPVRHAAAVSAPRAAAAPSNDPFGALK